MGVREINEFIRSPLFTVAGIGVSAVAIAQLLLLFAIVHFAARWLSRMVEARLARRELSTELAARLVARWVTVGVWTVGILIAADLLNIRFASFSFFAGALGLGVGFGLQTIINNFVSGLLILTERTLKTGDVVTVGGETGRLIHIGARATVLQTGKGSVLAVPNTQFISGPVINWSATGKGVALTIPFAIASTDDGEAAEECVLQVAKSHPLVFADPEPKVYLTRVGDLLSYELVVWVEEPIEKSRIVQNDINRALLQALRERGIAIRG